MRQVRAVALQVLFAWDAHGESDEPMALSITHAASDDAALRMRAYDMARGAWKEREAIDQTVQRLAPQWPPKRQPGVDRSIIRLAVWELTHADTPPKVVIDEAIELAKEYSTENSPAFVNGVLDALLREQQELKGGTAAPSHDGTK